LSTATTLVTSSYAESYGAPILNNRDQLSPDRFNGNETVTSRY
jgi:hypothetical protein